MSEVVRTEQHIALGGVLYATVHRDGKGSLTSIRIYEDVQRDASHLILSADDARALRDLLMEVTRDDA